MFRKTVFFLVFLLSYSATLLAQTPATEAVASAPRISSEDEIGAEFNNVPCDNKKRRDAVKALFERMGATPDEISVEKYGGAENVLIKIAGTVSPAEKIVIGAHFDKVSYGCGAIDNWTGIVSIAHIYRTMKSLKPNRTLIFVGFGEEEVGTVGSRAMVDKIKKEDVAGYCAMINIDSLGMTIPQAADNLSGKKMIELAADIAKQMGIEFAHGKIEGGSDSGTFLYKKIPAITIHGLTPDWPKVLHSVNDTSKRVNPQSVYLGYRLGLGLLARVDESACDAFREDKDKDKNGKGGKEKK